LVSVVTLKLVEETDQSQPKEDGGTSKTFCRADRNDSGGQGWSRKCAYGLAYQDQVGPMFDRP